MPTIKTKKEMNLPELIEWVFSKRNLDDEIFLSNKHNSVHVTDDGILEFFGTFYNDTFTVEIEEEITEDTVIPKLLEIDEDGVGFEWTYKSINEVKDYQTKTIHAIIYGKFKLVWEKYKGLVE